MRIVACIPHRSVIDQILTHLRTGVSTAAPGGARPPPLDPSSVGLRRHATTRSGPPGPLSLTPTPRPCAGPFGVRDRAIGA